MSTISTTNIDLSKRVPVLLKKLTHCFSTTQADICRRFDITAAEASLLSSMEPGRKLCSTALMERQDLSKGWISRLNESLCKKGYIIKNEHHDDRRHNIIELTERGQEVRQAIIEEQAAVCRRVLEHIPENERAMVLPALEQLVLALEQYKHEVGNADSD
ncbi:MAG TPA: MarR family winged helix-turn-helix transcriptional regulator [Nitrospirota bacterium]|nr:MarR family winged helix-turn-helix transcriptional regulator [Nitrospirota bacterium]